MTVDRAPRGAAPPASWCASIAVAVGGAAGMVPLPRRSSISFRALLHYVNRLPQTGSTAGRMPLRGQRRARPDAQKLKIVLFLGLFLALPVVLYQLWAFIVPGPDAAREEDVGAVHRRLDAPVRAGRLRRDRDVAEGPRVPAGLRGAGSHPADQLHAATWGSWSCVTLAFGLSFEFPVLLVFLVLVGVLSSAKLRAWRRWAILGIAIFAAVSRPARTRTRCWR